MNSKTQEISSTSTQIIVKHDEEDKYAFKELNHSKEIIHKFSDWIKTNMDKSDIKIQ